MPHNDNGLTRVGRPDPLEACAHAGEHISARLTVADSLVEVVIDDPSTQNLRSPSPNSGIARPLVFTDDRLEEPV